MDIDEYQSEALLTDRVPKPDDDSSTLALMVPMLGLAGEAGELVSEYKKYLRDGEAHHLFNERVSEELGDLLWYIAVVASRCGLSLSEVAASNIQKVRQRWTMPASSQVALDADLPADEQLPRRFSVSLSDEDGGTRHRVRVIVDGKPFGAGLTDNAYDPDGYRFHDIFHLAYAAVLEWSPVTRALLRRKRKSNPLVDEVEDGGRAVAIEEGVAALVFDYARRHCFLEGIKTLDYQLLRTVKGMTSHLEVHKRTAGEWEQAILLGFDVWRQVVRGRSGLIAVDLDARSVRWIESSE